jgi:mannosyltransferase
VAAGLAALTPVLWLGMHQRGDQLWWVPPLSPQVLWNFPGEIAGSVAAGWLVVGLAVVGLCRPLPERVVPAALMFGPLVTVGLVSALVTPYWVARYLLVVLAPLTLLAAAGLRDVLFVAERVATVRIPSQRRPVSVSQELIASAPGSGRALPAAPTPPPADEPLPPPPPPPAGRRSWPYAATALRVVAVLAVLVFAVYPGQEVVRGLHAKAGNDYRTAAQIIRKDQLPGDGIVYTANNRTMRAGLAFYLHPVPADVLSIKTGAANGQLHDTETAPTRARLAGTSRIWLFLDGRHKNPLYGRLDLAAPIKGQFHLDHIWYPQNATLALYVRDNA